MRTKQLTFLRKTSIELPFLFTFVFVISMAQLACAQQPAVQHSENKTSAEYSDCALIHFNDIDNSELTKAELLLKMDQDFAANLNKSEKCMGSAAGAGAGQLGATGAGQAGDAELAGSGGVGVTDSEESTNEQSSSGQQALSRPSTETKTGKGQAGSSAICGTVKQGFDNATTDTERKHFQGLMTQYGCE